MSWNDIYGKSLADQYSSTYTSTASSFNQANASSLARQNRDASNSALRNYQYTDPYGHRVVHSANANVRFTWNGWYTDLHSLSMAGWKISTHRDVMTQSDIVSMLLPGKPMALQRAPYPILQGGLEPVDLTEDAYYSRDVRMAFRIDEYSLQSARSYPISLPAPLDEFVIRRWEHQQRSPEIIVPKETVGDLLERITTMQQDARIERIRAKLRENSVDVPLPDMTNVTVIG